MPLCGRFGSVEGGIVVCLNVCPLVAANARLCGVPTNVSLLCQAGGYVWVWMRYVEEYCAGPVLEALEGFQKVWRSLCGVKSLLEGFSVSGSCLKEGWVNAGKNVLLGFWVLPAASAC